MGTCSWPYKNNESIERQIRDNTIEIDTFKITKETNFNNLANWTQSRSWDEWKKVADARCFGWNTGMHIQTKSICQVNI